MKLYSGTRIVVLAAALLPVSLAYSQQKPADAAKAKTVVPPGTVHRTADGHPDLSGTWTFGIDLPHGDLVKVVDGKVTRSHYDQSARHHVSNEVPGALAWDKRPFLQA